MASLAKAGHTLQELASLIHGRVVGDPSLVVEGASSLELAETGHLSYVAEESFWKMAESSRAAALVVKIRPPQCEKPCIEVAHPALAFAKIVTHLFQKNQPKSSFAIHASAVVAASAKVGRNVSMGPYVVVEEGAVIGDDSIIEAFGFVGAQVKIGHQVRCHPHVTLMERVVVGNRVVIHSGTVVGSDGFGFIKQEDGSHFKVPQAGVVRIEDDVEIGSNVSIDRATFGETLIGRGTKIDNFVQIAHNVVIGENVILVSQVGLSGSISIGRGAVLAGQVGVADHVKIGDGAVILAKAGISKDVPAGAVMFGYPAKEHREMAKQLAEVAMLPKLRARVKELEHRLSILEHREQKSENRGQGTEDSAG